MNFNIKKTMIGLLFAASAMHAAEVGFSGYILGGTGSAIDSEGTMTTSTYHEIDLTTSVKFSEKVSVDVFTTMVGDGSVDTNGVEQRWEPVLFDGVTLNYALDMGTLMVGDLVYANNSFGYYALKRTSPVLNETFVRGLGIDAGGLSVYAGSLDGDKTTSGLYAAYSVEAGDISVKPFAAFELGGEKAGDIPMTLGLDFGLSAGAFSLAASAGTIMVPDMDATTNILLEPAFDAGAFNVVASIYYSIQADEMEKRAGYEGLATTEEMFIYVEPGMPINDIVSVGLPLEYHAGDKDAESALVGAYPTVYFSVAKDASFYLWAGADQGIGDANKDDDMTYYIGSELTASF